MFIDDEGVTTKYANRWILKYGLEKFDLEEYQKNSVGLLQTIKVKKFRNFQYWLLLKRNNHEYGFIWIEFKEYGELQFFCEKYPGTTMRLLNDCTHVRPINKVCLSKIIKNIYCYNAVPFIVATTKTTKCTAIVSKSKH